MRHLILFIGLMVAFAAFESCKTRKTPPRVPPRSDTGQIPKDAKFWLSETAYLLPRANETCYPCEQLSDAPEFVDGDSCPPGGEICYGGYQYGLEGFDRVDNLNWRIKQFGDCCINNPDCSIEFDPCKANSHECYHDLSTYPDVGSPCEECYSYGMPCFRDLILKHYDHNDQTPWGLLQIENNIPDPLPDKDNEIINNWETSIISYQGDWRGSAVLGEPGGGCKCTYTTQPGASFTFTMYGNGVTIYGERAPTKGKGEVYVDGNFASNFTQYDSIDWGNDQYPIFGTDSLPEGWHLYKVVYTGKDELSEGNGGIAWHKAVRILLPPDVQPATDTVYNWQQIPSLVYSGDWRGSILQGQPGGGCNCSFSNVIGDYFEIWFRGTGIAFYGEENDHENTADVYLDGNLVHKIDQYADPGTGNEQILQYYVDNLKDSVHRLKIRVTGENTQSQNTYFAWHKAVIIKTDDFVPPEPESDSIYHFVDLDSIFFLYVDGVSYKYVYAGEPPFPGTPPSTDNCYCDDYDTTDYTPVRSALEDALRIDWDVIPVEDLPDSVQDVVTDLWGREEDYNDGYQDIDDERSSLIAQLDDSLQYYFDTLDIMRDTMLVEQAALVLYFKKHGIPYQREE